MRSQSLNEASAHPGNSPTALRLRPLAEVSTGDSAGPKDDPASMAAIRSICHDWLAAPTRISPPATTEQKQHQKNNQQGRHFSPLHPVQCRLGTKAECVRTQSRNPMLPQTVMCKSCRPQGKKCFRSGERMGRIAAASQRSCGSATDLALEGGAPVEEIVGRSRASCIHPATSHGLTCE